MNPKKQISTDEALDKIKKLCSAEEKCCQEVRKKLFNLGINSADAEKIINHLIDEKYIDEWRYARMFASGKFRNNKWGKIKIRYELLRKNIAENIIEDATRRIDGQDYKNLLKKELLKKQKSVSANNSTEIKGKLHRFASSKGFEYEVITRVLEEIVDETDEV